MDFYLGRLFGTARTPNPTDERFVNQVDEPIEGGFFNELQLVRQLTNAELGRSLCLIDVLRSDSRRDRSLMVRRLPHERYLKTRMSRSLGAPPFVGFWSCGQAETAAITSISAFSKT